MAPLPAPALLGSIVKNLDLLAAAMVQHPGVHLGAFHPGGAHPQAGPLADGQNFFEDDRGIGLGRQGLHADDVPFGDPILLTTGGYNRVHDYSSCVYGALILARPPGGVNAVAGGAKPSWPWRRCGRPG